MENGLVKNHELVPVKFTCYIGAIFMLNFSKTDGGIIIGKEQRMTPEFLFCVIGWMAVAFSKVIKASD